MLRQPSDARWCQNDHQSMDFSVLLMRCFLNAAAFEEDRYQVCQKRKKRLKFSWNR